MFMFMDSINIMHIAWDTKHIMIGDESNNKDTCIYRAEMFAGHLKSRKWVPVKLLISNSNTFIEIDT